MNAWDDFTINDEFVEIPRSFLQSSDWNVLFASRMRMPEHITLLEGRAVVQTLRHKTRAQESFHKRHLHLGDNLGMTLCLDRGRAKNKQLLFQCRRVAAFNIAADSEFHHRWIPSELNPADAPSRRYEWEGNEGSKRKKQKIIESIIYPDRAKHSEAEEASKALEEHLRNLEGISEALPGSESVGQTSRHEKKNPRSFRSWSGCKAAETDCGARCMSSKQQPKFSGTSSSVSENSQGLPVQVGSVSTVLSPQQAFDQICSSSRYKPANISRAVFQGWHEHQRGHKVLGSDHRFEARVITKACASPLTPCSEGMEKSGSRMFSPSRSMASDRTSGIQDGGSPKVDPCHVHPDHVRDILPAVRTTAATEAGSGGVQGPRDSVVSSPEQIRRYGTVKNRNARRKHGLEQQGSAVVRHDAEDNLIEADIKIPLQHRLPRPQQVLEGRNEGSRSPRQLHGALPTETLRGIMGPGKRLQKPVRSQTQGKMGIRHQHAAIREACYGHAKVHKPVPKDTEKCAGGSSSPQSSMRRRSRKDKAQSSSLTCLELFSGSGHLSKKLRSHGLTVESWDILAGPQFDLLKRQNVEDIIDRICAKTIAYVHVGLPCQSWSRARRSDGRGPGPLRDDDRFLMGLKNLSAKDREKVLQGNRLLHHTLRILLACIQHNVLWTLENPMTSRVWKTRAAKKLAKHAVFHRADFCQYNQPWRKATYFLAHPELPLVLKHCCGTKGLCSRTQQPHIVLQGVDSKGTFLTKVAEPYPFSLANHIAQKVKQSLQ